MGIVKRAQICIFGVQKGRVREWEKRKFEEIIVTNFLN